MVTAIAIVLTLATTFCCSGVTRNISKAWGYLIGESEMLVAAILPALVFSRFEKRPFGVYGLPRRRAFGKTVLGRRPVGTCGHHASAAGDASGWSFLLWRPGSVRRAHSEVCRLLGIFFPGGWLLRGIPRARLQPIYPDPGHGLLAGGHFAFCLFGAMHLGNRRGGLGGSAFRRADRILLLPHPAAHRHVVVCRGLPCRLGLGREFFLFRAR